MKRLAVPLLLAVAVTHFGYELIALAYTEQAAAAKAWFYMLRGLEGVVLFGAIAALSKSLAVTLVCALGIWEEGLTVACRASKPIGEALGYAPFVGLCGREWYWIGLAALGLVALGIAYDLGKDRGQKRP